MQEQQSRSAGGGGTSGALNHVVIVGRAGQDPELKYFESGSIKGSFSLAVNRPGPKDNRPTDWFNVEVWGRTAEIVGEYLKKGREVCVSGRLSVRKWLDDAGNEREFLSVVASDVQLIGSRREGNSDYASAGGGSGYQAGSWSGGGGSQYSGMPGASMERAPF